MGIGLLIAGLVFFCNPSFGVFDFLPDAVGCLLMIAGLRKLSDLSSALADAKSGFVKLFIVYLLKFFSFFPLRTVPESEKIWQLIAVFVFGIFEVILLFPSFGRLFDGISYLSVKFPSPVFDKNRQNVTSFTMVFFGVRLALNVIPELSYLISRENEGWVTPFQTEQAGSYDLLTLVNLFFVGLLGIVFLGMVLPYFVSIAKDRDLIRTMEDTYREEVLSDRNRMLARSFSLPLLLLTLSACFLPGIYLEGTPYLPEFLLPLFALPALFLLRDKSEKTKAATVAAVCSCLVSTVFFGFELFYRNEYYLADIMKWPKAYRAFVPLTVLSCLSSLLLGVLLVLLFRLFGELIENYSGTDSSDPVLVRLDGTRPALRRMNRSALISGLVSCLSHAVMTGVMSGNRSTLFLKISQYHFVDVILSLLFVFLAWRFLSSMKEAIEKRFL